MNLIAENLRLFFAPERRAWRGEMRLAVVFWGYGVGTSLGIAILHAAALAEGALIARQAIILFTAAYTVWIVVAIWRAAANAAAFWGSLARWLTVAWALNSAFVLFFLQIDLVLKYVRG